jgi:Oxidoreductase molybdopterin binding domain
MDCAPGDLVPLVAYRLNGQPIPLERGGPVRMVIPWAHGFKSIKWLQRITLTNEYRAMDTYAHANNDPDSYLKTAAYVDGGLVRGTAGQPLTITGTVMVGLPGLRRVEYWLREVPGRPGPLPDNDPAWRTARWQPCTIAPPPQDWGGALPDGVFPRDVWGFDAQTGRPREWPMRYSWALWSVTLNDLRAGNYEFRARSVDQNDFAQPEPRPYPKSGRNEVQMKPITIM